MSNILPLFYFPSTLLLVDDNELLLRHLRKVLEQDYKIITTTEPCKVNSILETHASINFKTLSNLISLEFTDYHYSDGTHLTLKFDFKKINDLMCINNRNELISILIVDYKMPEMTGLNLCKIINDKYIKKILLTAESKDKQALIALQDQLINGHIPKGEPNTIKTVKETVAKLQFEFFQELTLPIVKNLELLGCTYLTDEIFIKFFLNLFNKHNFTEYFMANINGIFKLKDKTGNNYILIVQDDVSLSKYFVEPYNQIDGVEDITNLVMEKKLIPFFGIDNEPLDTPINQWKNHLYSSNVLNADKKNYYWALITQ